MHIMPYTPGGEIYALQHWWHNLHLTHLLAYIVPYTPGGEIYALNPWWHNLHHIHSVAQFAPCTLVTQIALHMLGVANCTIHLLAHIMPYTPGGAIYAFHPQWHNLHHIHSVAQFAPCTLVTQIILYTLGGANCTSHTPWHTLCLTHLVVQFMPYTLSGTICTTSTQWRNLRHAHW